MEEKFFILVQRFSLQKESTLTQKYIQITFCNLDSFIIVNNIHMQLVKYACKIFMNKLCPKNNIE